MELSDSKQVIVERHNKVVYVDGGRIVKVFKATKPASDVFNEALNIARVIEAGVRVPKVLEVSQVTDGSWALSTEYVEGVTMRSLMDAAEGTPEYDKLLEQGRHHALADGRRRGHPRVRQAPRAVRRLPDRDPGHPRL